jgi:hypothetical protein
MCNNLTRIGINIRVSVPGEVRPEAKAFAAVADPPDLIENTAAEDTCQDK